MKQTLTRLLIAAGLSGLAATASAQWLTQSMELKAGWNAVFLHVDASHDTLNALVGGDGANPILEVWRWNPPAAAQFTENPAAPTATAEWSSWVRSQPDSALQRLSGDTAYLVRINTNVASYNWKIKGRPVAPRHEWTITGLNLIGFPTVTNNPPKFDAFLAQAPELQSATPEIYFYPGGELSSNNPALLPAPLFRFTTVKRGQAFWMRSGTVFNRYFGPFELLTAADSGAHFGERASSISFRLRNLTASNLTVTLRLTASETPPVGQPDIATVPPLLLRGNLNLTNLTYGYTNLPANTPRTWTLAGRNLPGAEVEVVLGLNRSAITVPTGTLLAGILSFTDSMGHSQVEVPVSATAASRVGLWVGNAAVNQVGQYLKAYARGPVTNAVASTNGDYAVTVATNALLTGADGSYIVTNLDTSTGAVARTFPLRLIIHNPSNGPNAVLLQRVYQGFDAATNVVVARLESVLHTAYLKDARRISCTHLPWTANNTAWALSGKLGAQTNLTATVALDFADQASNPFLHTYHPDHDNLDATFKRQLLPGEESYGVQRVITLLVKPPGDDFSSLVAGAETVTGDYLEIITLTGLTRGATNETRQFKVFGAFTLNRISDVPTLTPTMP